MQGKCIKLINLLIKNLLHSISLTSTQNHEKKARSAYLARHPHKPGCRAVQGQPNRDLQIHGADLRPAKSDRAVFQAGQRVLPRHRIHADDQKHLNLPGPACHFHVTPAIRSSYSLASPPARPRLPLFHRKSASPLLSRSRLSLASQGGNEVALSGVRVWGHCFSGWDEN